VATTPDEMITRNTFAIEALGLAVERLRELRKGKELTVRKRYTREIARANEEITDLEIVNAHLRAAGTVIDPIDNGVQSRLDVLADRIDAAIRNDFKINAAFDTVLDVISFAEEIGAIIDSHEHA
jgi:hypothetical protein